MTTEKQNVNLIDGLSEEILSLLTAKGLTAKEAENVLRMVDAKITSRVYLHIAERQTTPLKKLFTE